MQSEIALKLFGKTIDMTENLKEDSENACNLFLAGKVAKVGDNLILPMGLLFSDEVAPENIVTFKTSQVLATGSNPNDFMALILMIILRFSTNPFLHITRAFKTIFRAHEQLFGIQNLESLIYFRQNASKILEYKLFLQGSGRVLSKYTTKFKCLYNAATQQVQFKESKFQTVVTIEEEQFFYANLNHQFVPTQPWINEDSNKSSFQASPISLVPKPVDINPKIPVFPHEVYSSLRDNFGKPVQTSFIPINIAQNAQTKPVSPSKNQQTPAQTQVKLVFKDGKYSQVEGPSPKEGEEYIVLK